MQVKDVAGYLKRADRITIIMGAGASISAGIPKAIDLVKQVNQNYAHCLTGLSDEDRKDYGRAMGALSPADRKSLIQPLLDRSRINWGHIALSCLIRKCTVERILTFNFDLVLERSASLLGMHLPVYDFGVSPTKEIAGLAAPAIYHLHGQSYGLRLMNSGDETRQHAEQLRPVLADSLRNHLTIVTGYSGEADGAFRVIEEEFNEQTNLIWLGYADEPGRHLKTLLAKNYATYIGGCDFDITMIDIAQELGCFPPDVIRNPPSHVLEELKEVVDYPVQPETGLDILTDTRRRLEDAADKWQGETGSEGAALMALVSKEEIGVGDAATMSDSERDARAWRYVTSGSALLEAAKRLPDAEALAKLAEAETKYAAALEIKPDMHEALYNWGNALWEAAKRLPEAGALAKLAEAETKYAAALEIKPDKHEALYNWGSALLDAAKRSPERERQARLKKALEKCREAKRISGRANYNLACVHALLGDAGAAFEELEACLRDGTLPDRAHLESDDDLAGLRGQSAFEALLAKLGPDDA